MRGLLTIDRLIVSQLLGSFERGATARGEDARLEPNPVEVWAERLWLSVPALRRTVAIVAAACGLVAAMVSLWAACLVCAASVAFVVIRARRKYRARRDALERDLPALLTSVASSVRAGVDPLRALCDAESYFPAGSPFVDELQIFRRRLAAGEDEIVAIEGLMSQYEHSDIELFKRCLVLSRTHGSSLAEPLHRVTRVVRQRQSFRRKTKAALAMHRMSALGIALCALVIGGMQFVMNIAGVRVALAHPMGLMLLSLGAVLIVSGVAWMLTMGREERL